MSGDVRHSFRTYLDSAVKPSPRGEGGPRDLLDSRPIEAVHMAHHTNHGHRYYFRHSSLIPIW